MFEYELVTDRPKYRIYKISTGYMSGSQTKAKKFPCIGGPKNGERLTQIDLNLEKLAEEYITYNYASGGWRGNPSTQVYIHRDLIAQC